jgi:ABC-type multidrug transport system ATPase subunit
MAGPSFLLFVYCIQFFFANPENASRQAFMILSVVLLIPIIVDIVQGETTPEWLEWIYSLIPSLGILRLLTHMLVRIGIWKQGLQFYFKSINCRPYLFMQYGNIVIYGLILMIIEKVRLYLDSRSARRAFGNYGEFFRKQREKHPKTDEVKEMEENVRHHHNFAVRIWQASRLFFNTAGDPIPAVNSVSLGIPEGCLFGFLGANGAGKTTLMKMITSMLPPSDGVIEILGEDITHYSDPTLLSICPQFNTHLCDEMTPREHFELYSMLFQLPEKEAKSRCDRLIRVMELEDIIDKPLRELSGGDVRKLSIAMCFMGPAKIVLLDEPTASLDPVARKRVHEMILEFKGEVTFMLCTHLLSEAESLCDLISIMIKGCVYTIGTPQYLSQKFGTEYKVDVMLDDESEATGSACDKFFSESLPNAVLSIMRPRARIYNVPAADLTLPELFNMMEKGKNNDGGFSYYTCSTSSLERVFMEIVHLSEGDGGAVVHNPNVNSAGRKKEEEKEKVGEKKGEAKEAKSNDKKKEENEVKTEPKVEAKRSSGNVFVVESGSDFDGYPFVIDT